VSDKIIVWSELTVKQREAILKKHRLWLESAEGGQRADLRGAYLRGAYLRGADLRGADLRGAYLRGAYLQGADLQGADLQGAYLQGADLQGAYLQGADGNKLKVLAIYQCGPQGSRGDYLVSFLCNDNKVYFSTGCVHNMEQKEFLKRAASTHDGNQHGKAYKAAIAHCVKMLKLQQEPK